MSNRNRKEPRARKHPDSDRALVVDDEEMLKESVSMGLKNDRLGGEPQGDLILRSRLPAIGAPDVLAVLDIMMPGLTAWSLPYPQVLPRGSASFDRWRFG